MIFTNATKSAKEVSESIILHKILILNAIEVQSSESLRLLLILPFAFRNKLSHGTDLHREIVELEVKHSLYLNLCHREHTGKTKGNDLPAKQI